MREFDLVSVDWDTVRLMQAGQFKQETFYLEELVRWTLLRGRMTGVFHLVEGGVSRPGPEGYQTFSVTARGCYGVTAQGYLIEIPDDPRMALQGAIEAQTNIVPLYVGVDKSGKSAEPQLHPSVDTGLLQCGGRRRAYRLSSSREESGWDWLQIAQFQKTPSGLNPDPTFLPECMFMSSHAGLLRIQQEIRDLARGALQTLQTHSSDLPQVFASAAALASSLGPATQGVNGRQHPHDYVDRLAGILTAQRSQLHILPDPKLVAYQQAIEALDEFLDYLESAWALGQALTLARACFERLLYLYPLLLRKLGEVGPEPERKTFGHDIVVPVPDMDGDEAPRRRFWRK